MLVEGPSRETGLLWEARLATQAPEIDGLCLINDFAGGAPRPGQFRRSRITETHDYDLVGTLLEESPEEHGAATPTGLLKIVAGTP